MRSFMALGLVASLASLGCGNPASPTPQGIRTVSGAAPAPIPPAGPPISALAVSAVTLQLSYVGSTFQYYPTRLALRETSGKSSATVQTFTLSTPNGFPDGVCLGIPPIRIGPGLTLELIPALGYCGPAVGTQSLSSAVTFSLTFVDDDGRPGLLEHIVNVSGCTLGDHPAGSIACN